MNKLRWLITRNKVTVDMVRTEVKRTDSSMSVCKARLVNETKPVLQQWGRVGLAWGWADVPVIVEER